MHKSDLVAAVAEAAGLKRDQADRAISAALEHMTNTLARGESVAIAGLGSFIVRARAERNGRSPRTGEPIRIPAKNSVGFRPAKALKDALSAAS